MTDEELQIQYESDFLELRKLINSWETIPSISFNELDTFVNNILGHLYRSSDMEKLSKVISSELIITFGLYSSEFDSQRLTENIFEWWNAK